MNEPELEPAEMMAEPDEALQGAGWCTGGGVFGKGAPLQALSFGECPRRPASIHAASLYLNAPLA